MNTEHLLSKYWGWIFFIGIILVIIGAIAIATPFVATITSVVVFGWLLIFSGIIQLLYSFFGRHTNSLFMQSFVALLTILIGILMVSNPTVTAMALTLLLAVFFLTAGIFKIYGAVVWRFPQWGWTLVSGILSFILGILILVHWPSSALWVIGLFIGIDLIFTGWSLMAGSFVFKKLSQGQNQ